MARGKKRSKKKRVTGVPKRKPRGPDVLLPVDLNLPDELEAEVTEAGFELRITLEKGKPRVRPANPHHNALWRKILSHPEFDADSLKVDESRWKEPAETVDKVTGEPLDAPLGRAAVDSCMFLLGWLHKEVGWNPEGSGNKKLVQEWRCAWSSLRESRIIEFPTDAWWRLMEQLDRVYYSGFHKERDVDEEETFHDYLSSVCRRFDMRPPEELPFSQMWIGLERGIPITKSKVAWLNEVYNIDNVTEADGLQGEVILLGYQVAVETDGFRITELLHTTSGAWSGVMPSVYRYDSAAGTWTMSDDGPGIFLVKLIIDIINDHRRFIVKKGKGAKSFRRLRKAAERQQSIGYIPAPYYVVRLQDKLIDDVLAEKCASRPRILGHRYDRRGHERCYVRRGPLPLDEELRAKLEKKGYKIFTMSYPDAGTNRRMAERGMHLKQHDEWIAILTKWIKHAVCGDEALPYVPAVRVPTKLAG